MRDDQLIPLERRGASVALIVRKELAQRNALLHGKFPHGGIHAPRAARYDFVHIVWKIAQKVCHGKIS